MLSKYYSEAVYGMLYYYGMIPLSDLLTISFKCGLCEPSDYGVCLDIISFSLIKTKKAYFVGNRLCHRMLRSEKILEDMQEYLKISGFKVFETDKYIKAGSEHILFSKEMEILANTLATFSKPSPKIKFEVIRIWSELNNMSDLIALTNQSIDNLEILYMSRDEKFIKIMTAINKLANEMPRWFCKGYSLSEILDSRGYAIV